MANRFLNNITINEAYTLPSADGTNGQVITTDGSGILSFADQAPSDAIVLTVKNVSGGSLSKGTVVYVSPSANPPSGNVIEVSAADNSSASTMPALAVLNTTLADEAEGEAIAFGQLSDIDTSAFTAGDAIYVNTSGGFTSTKPTGTALIQKIGMVVKSHASNGSIKIFGAFRSNDVPNILQDYIWLGNSSGVASPTEHLLNNVKDVTLSSPSHKNVLAWDNINGYWENTLDIRGIQYVGRDDADYIEFNSNQKIDFYLNSINQMKLEANGDFHVGGDVVAASTTLSSDRKLKDNIEVISDALDIIENIEGVNFDWKKSGDKASGVIAQDVQKVMPHLVKEVSDLDSNDTHLAVNYDGLIGVLIQAVKELSSEVEQLKNK